MNTWIVGHVPVGHYAYDYRKVVTDTEKKSVALGEKVFFMKGRIMAGQANIKDNQFGVQDFRWLVKEEIKDIVTTKYWSMVENMLAER